MPSRMSPRFEKKNTLWKFLLNIIVECNYLDYGSLIR